MRKRSLKIGGGDGPTGSHLFGLKLAMNRKNVIFARAVSQLSCDYGMIDNINYSKTSPYACRAQDRSATQSSSLGFLRQDY
jgi:hypothetical protein